MENHSLLKINISSTDKTGHDLMYEKIVVLARKSGISGVTVYRGIMGYGSSNKIEAVRFWELTEKLPVVIEIIDTLEKIESFYSSIETLLQESEKGCLVSIQPITILLQKSGRKK